MLLSVGGVQLFDHLVRDVNIGEGQRSRSVDDERKLRSAGVKRLYLELSE